MNDLNWNITKNNRHYLYRDLENSIDKDYWYLLRTNLADSLRRQHRLTEIVIISNIKEIMQDETD